MADIYKIKDSFVEVLHRYDNGDVKFKHCGQKSAVQFLSKEAFDKAFEKVELPAEENENLSDAEVSEQISKELAQSFPGVPEGSTGNGLAEGEVHTESAPIEGQEKV